MGLTLPSRATALAIAIVLAALPVLVTAAAGMPCARTSPKGHECCPERAPARVLQANAPECGGDAPCCSLGTAPARQPAAKAPIQPSPAGLAAKTPTVWAATPPAAAAAPCWTHPGHAPPVLERKTDLRI